MTRVRSDRRQAHLDRLHEAQGGCCYLCGGEMVEAHRYKINAGWSADHVRPRSLGWTRWQNLLLAHAGCNRAKGDREPFPCEILLLEAVNARLGHERDLRHGYQDNVTAPSVIAIALQLAMAA